MKQRMIRFDDELVLKIQDFANRQFDGNFSEAVRYACAKVARNEKHSNTINGISDGVRRD